MNETITTADDLDELLYGLNEAGHMPKVLVVDRCDIAALAWCEEDGGDDLVTGVTMAGPREDEDLEGGRDRPTSSLYFPVRILYRPDAEPTVQPTADAVAQALYERFTSNVVAEWDDITDESVEPRSAYLDAARAVLALLPGRSEAEVKAEALRDAVGMFAASESFPREVVQGWLTARAEAEAGER